MTLYSKSQRTQYHCPKCRSWEVIGPVLINKKKALVCGQCLTWTPWENRIQIRLGKPGPIPGLESKSLSGA